MTHVENHIRWAPNHQAIEFNTDFNGKPHYYGFYAYNPVAKTIGFYYTNSEGELTIGTATPDPDGKTLHQEFDIMHPNGKHGPHPLNPGARRQRRLLVHRLHAEGRRVGAGVQDSLRAEVSRFSAVSIAKMSLCQRIIVVCALHSHHYRNPRESSAFAHARPTAGWAAAASGSQQHHRRGLRQGRRRQNHSGGEPGHRAGAHGPQGRAARCRRVWAQRSPDAGHDDGA